MCLVDPLSGTTEPCNGQHVVLTQEKALGEPGRPGRPAAQSQVGWMSRWRRSLSGMGVQIPKRRDGEGSVLGAQELLSPVTAAAYPEGLCEP